MTVVYVVNDYSGVFCNMEYWRRCSPFEGGNASDDTSKQLPFTCIVLKGNKSYMYSIYIADVIYLVLAIAFTVLTVLTYRHVSDFYKDVLGHSNGLPTSDVLYLVFFGLSCVAFGVFMLLATLIAIAVKDGVPPSGTWKSRITSDHATGIIYILCELVLLVAVLWLWWELLYERSQLSISKSECDARNWSKCFQIPESISGGGHELCGPDMAKKYCSDYVESTREIQNWMGGLYVGMTLLMILVLTVIRRANWVYDLAVTE